MPKKMDAKHVDMIIANDVLQKGAGFDVDTNIVSVLFKDGRREDLELMTKVQLSERLMECIEKEFFLCSINS